MARLAIRGGKPVREVKKRPWPVWPVFNQREEKQLLQVVRSRVWSYNGPKEQEFNRRFKAFVGTRYALLVANGTVSLQLALEALDIGFGDEVIVPGLTWQATAGAVLDVNAVPILVDVDPNTWCLDPEALEKAITPRTRAVIPVHLYGCIADMDAVHRLARKHKLFVIEDCAHQHGSIWSGKQVGSLGDIGSFSLQLSKVLTAGEGGILTTSDANLFTRLDALRNCGRRPAAKLLGKADKGAGQYGVEGDLIQSGNYRITEFQAAVLLEQLRRLPAQVRLRDRNAIYLNARLAQIPGIYPMKRDSRTDLQSYYNFAFRYDRRKFKGLPVARFREALNAELSLGPGGVEACYQPLNDCSLYRPLTKKRYRLSEKHWRRINPARFKLPECEQAYRETSVCLHHRILLANHQDMDQIADAVEKIRENLEDIL